MRACKIVPVSVAILLTTVLFAGVVTVSATTTGTTATIQPLEIWTSDATPLVGATYKVAGYLKTAAGVAIGSAGVDIWVRHDTDNGIMWKTLKTDSKGYFWTYASSTKKAYIRAIFNGDSTNPAAKSNLLTVTPVVPSDPLNVKTRTNTPTIYYVPQAGSTWVNHGTIGASYNAYVSNPNLFKTQSNGYPYWGPITKNDFVGIPAGSATNNQNVASWEIGFHFTGIVSGQRFQKIWDKAYGGFFIEIDTFYGANRCYLTIYRATTGGSGARWYVPTDTVLRAGHNYYIQIAWDTSAGPGHEPYPTVWIGEDGKAPVHQTHWDESGGALAGTGSWYNDAVGSANLGNTASDVGNHASAKTAWLNGGVFVYRQYNSIVNFSSGGSWNTDKLRWA